MKIHSHTIENCLSHTLLIQLTTIMLTVLFFIGCNSSGSGNSTPDVLLGTFLDSPVEGVNYMTDTLEGITDEDGTFQYMEGETIHFSIGDIQLGQGVAQTMMTPVDLVPGAVDETHPTVTNICRFLQTLDEDHNPQNGITISEDVMSILGGHSIDFTMDPADFEDHPDVQSIMNELNHMTGTDDTWLMVSIEDAQSHMGATMMEIMGTMMNDEPVPVSEGVFLDSAVEGISYSTDTQSGMTDEDGTFQYIEGEMVTLSIGDILLGNVAAEPMLTPVDLVPGANDETDPTVTNMTRFLQTLDEDHNPQNGITISEDVMASLEGHSVNFAMDHEDFENHSDVQSVMDELNHMSGTDDTLTMVSIEDAQDHMGATLTEMMVNYN